MRIACGQRLDLTIGQHRFIQVLTGTGRRFSAHHLGYEPLLCLNELPRIGVKCPFRHIAVDEHLFVGISLPDGPALPLLYVAWPPRHIQMMLRCKQRLHVRARSHFLRAAQQDAHLTRAHLCEQLRLFLFVVRVMNERDLAGRHAVPDQLVPYIGIHAERCRLYRSHAVRHAFDLLLSLWRGQVAEYKLCPFGGCKFLPEPEHLLYRGIDLAARLIRQKRIDEPLVQRQLAAIVCNFQHIVLAGVYIPVPHRLGAFAQFSHHFPLDVCGLYHNIFPLHLRHRQIQHIRCLDIRRLAPQRHQLRQIVEPGKPRAHPVSRPLRLQLHRRGHFPERGRPFVEQRQAPVLQHTVLQIPHHRIQFRHAVGDRRACGKHHAAPARQLVKILAFGKQVAGFLRFRLRDTRHISQLCVQKKVLKIVRLINEKAVNAQFFKGHNIILAAVIIETLQPCFQPLARPFHLLDRKARRIPVHKAKLRGDLVDLALEHGRLPLRRQRDLLKL